MGQRCWWFLLVFTAACFSPQFDDSKLQCGPNSLCPPGFECVGDVCVAGGGGPRDGGPGDGDLVAPAAPQLTGITPGSPANSNTPLLIGLAEPGAAISIFAAASCGGTAVATGTAESLASPGIAVSVVDDSTTTFTARARDAAGNESPCSSTLAFTEDSTPPPAPILSSTLPASPSRSMMPRILGAAAEATDVTIYAGTTCGGAELASGAVTAGAFDVAVAAPSNAVTQFSARSRDAAGNLSACSTSSIEYVQNAQAVSTPTLGSAVPASPNNDSTTPMIQGSTEPSVSVKLYADPACNGTVLGTTTSSSADGSFAFPVTVGANTTTTFYAQAQDTVVGVFSLCSDGLVYTHDTLAPATPLLGSLTPAAISNSTTPTVNGIAEPNVGIELFTTSDCSGTAVTGTANAVGGFAVTASTVSAPVTFHARATDAAGNSSGCSTGLPYTFDNTAPPAPTMIVTVPASPSATSTAPEVRGLAEVGSTVNVYRTTDCSAEVAGSDGVGSGTGVGAFIVGITVASNASSSLGVSATDAAGNSSPCVMVTYMHDSLPPAAPLLMTSTPASPASMNSPSIAGTTEAGARVQLYSDVACTTAIGAQVTADVAGMFTSVLTLADNTTTSVRARATDAAGNVSTCSTALTYVEDSAAPTAPVLNAVAPSSTITTPTLTGSAEAATTIELFTTADCSGAVLMMSTVAGDGTFALPVTVTANSSSPFSARTRDGAGNTSGCAAPITYIHDNMTPGAPTGLSSNPTSPAGDNSPVIVGVAEAGSTVRLFTNPGCSSAVASTTTATAGDAFSASLTVASGSTTTFYANATDAANNTSTCSALGVTYTQDSAPPAAPTGLITTPSSPSSSTTPMVSGSAEAGSTVRLYTNSTCTTFLAMGTASGGGAFSIATTVPANGTTGFWATATDTAANVSPCSTSTATFLNDALAPGAPVTTSVAPGLLANNNNPVLNGTAEAGSTVRVYTSATCSSGLVSSGPATGGNFAITLTVGDNSTTTFYATATDAAGNASGCVLATTYQEDSTAPATPTGLNTNPVSPVASTAPQVTGSGDAGSTVTIYTNAACSSAVSGFGVVAAGGMFSIPVSVAANSTTTFYARASDDAGNQSGCSTSNVIYQEDSSPPSMPVLTGITPSPANNNTPQVTGTGDTGSSIQLYSDAGCTSAIGTAQTVVGGAFAITVTVGADSTTTFRARATDAANNQSACSTTTRTFVEDSTAPGNPAGLATTPASGSNFNTPSITGTAEAGATVTAYTSPTCITSTGPGVVASGTGAFSLQVSVGDSSTTTFYLRATDAAGNASACTASITYVEDSAGVSPPTLVSTTPASPTNASLTPTINGTTSAGFGIKLYTTSNCTGGFATATADAAGNFTVVGTATANTTTTFYATSTSLAPVTSPCSTGITYTHDAIAPAIPAGLASSPVSPSNVNTPTITGTADAGTTVRLYTNAACSSAVLATGAASAGGTFAITLAALAPDSTRTIWATSTDAAGNTSACSASSVVYQEDSTNPGLPVVTGTSPASPSNANTSPSITGTGEVGSTISIYTTADCSGAVAGTATVAIGGAFGAPVSVSTNSTTTFRARAQDPAGNSSACSSTSTTYTHDSTAPARPAGLAVAPVGPANNNSPTVSGSAEGQSTVRLYSNATCTSAVIGSGSALAGGTFSVTATVPDNSITTIYATSTDAANNTSPCSTSTVSYTEDTAAPSTPVITGSTPTSPSRTSTTPTLAGTAEAGTTVRLYTLSNCTGTIAGTGTAAGAPSVFSIAVTATANAQTTFYARATDGANNASGCSAGFTYTHDSNAPATPSITSTNPASNSNVNTPVAGGTAEVGSTVRIYSDACVTEIASGTTTGTGAFAITVNVPDNSTTALRATATDAAGNTSGCSTALTYVEDSLAPDAPTLTTLDPKSPSSANTVGVTGATDQAALIKLYSDAACTSALLGTGASDAGGAFVVDATVPANSTTTIYATATDDAGNASPCSADSLIYVEDSLAPAAPTALATSPAGPANNNTPSVTLTAEANTLVSVYRNATCTTLVNTGTSTTSSFSIQVPVSNNTTTSYWATSTDGAGNVSPCSTSSATYVEDSVASPPVLSSTSPISPSNTSTTFLVIGTGEALATIRLYANSATCSGASLVTTSTISAGGAFSISVAVSSNTSTTYTAQITDQAGNVSACSSTSVTYTHDSTAPTMAAPTSVVATSTTSLLVMWASATDAFTTAANMRYELCWRADPVTSTCLGTVITGPGATNRALTGLTVGTRYWVYVRAIDQAGNTGAYSGPTSDRTWGPGAAKAIAAGNTAACAAMSDGTVKCWGNNNNGQIGDNSTTDRAAPTEVSGLVDVVQVATGPSGHACALKSDGKVWCWGTGTSGQLGNGGGVSSLVPVQVLFLTNAIGVAVGEATSCAVLQTGVVSCWGSNTSGALGTGSNAPSVSNTATTVTGVANAVAVKMGMRHACALIADGTVKCWGENSNGQLGNASTTSTPTPVTALLAAGDGARQLTAGSFHSCAVLKAGTVKCWGYDGDGQLGQGATAATRSTPVLVQASSGVNQTNVIGISAGGVGFGHTCAVLVDGTARCWGHNASGQLGNNSTTLSAYPVVVSGATNVAQISAGTTFTCARRADGTGYCWGNGGGFRLGTGTTSGSQVPVPVVGLSGPEGGVEIRGGNTSNYHVCSRISNGQIYCWGLNTSGQLGDGENTARGFPGPAVLDDTAATITNATQIAVGGAHACARLATGTVRCWGNGGSGRLGNTATNNQSYAVEVSGISNAMSVGVGGSHSCAVLVDGTAKCWGLNNFGQLGNASTVTPPSNTPVVVSGLANAVEIEGLGLATCARLTDGTAKCWGYNFNGTLGDGTLLDRSVPTAVVGGVANVRELAVFRQGACVLIGNTSKCWGQGGEGQIGLGALTPSNPTPQFSSGSDFNQIGSGEAHICATNAAGTPKCWGRNDTSQIGNGGTTDVQSPYTVSSLSSILAITGGTDYSCGLHADGTAECWGGGANGVLGDGITGAHTVATPAPVLYFP